MLLKKLDSLFCAIKYGSINILNTDETIKSLAVCSSGGKFAQICSLAPIYSSDQILFALEQALDSFKKGTSISDKPQIEFLIRVSGSRQIGRALEIAGLKEGRNEVALVAAAGSEGEALSLMKDIEKKFAFSEDEGLLERTKNKKSPYLKKIFGISEKHLESLKRRDDPLEEAILEKIALLGLEG